MLIDARLDAIDRALLGRVSRAERLDVVGEVESRIDELLHARCGPSEPSREDVLAVLAQLDPPEAYLEGDDEPAGRPRAFAGPRRPSSVAGAATAPVFDFRRCDWWSGVSGLLALAAVLLIPALYLVVILTKSELILLVGGAFLILWGLGASAAAVVLAAMSRLCGRWSAVGLVLGLLCGLLTVASTMLAFYL